MDNPDTYSIGHKIQNEYKTKQHNTGNSKDEQHGPQKTEVDPCFCER